MPQLQRQEFNFTYQPILSNQCIVSGPQVIGQSIFWIRLLERANSHKPFVWEVTVTDLALVKLADFTTKFVEIRVCRRSECNIWSGLSNRFQASPGESILGQWNVMLDFVKHRLSLLVT